MIINLYSDYTVVRAICRDRSCTYQLHTSISQLYSGKLVRVSSMSALFVNRQHYQVSISSFKNSSTASTFSPSPSQSRFCCAVTMPFLAQKHFPIPTKDIASWVFDEEKYDWDRPVSLHVPRILYRAHLLISVRYLLTHQHPRILSLHDKLESSSGN
jgi:hypothetical protein